MSPLKPESKTPITGLLIESLKASLPSQALSPLLRSSDTSASGPHGRPALRVTLHPPGSEPRLSAADSHAEFHKSTPLSAPPSQFPKDAHPQMRRPDSPPPTALSPCLPPAAETPAPPPVARPKPDGSSRLQRKPPEACPGSPLPVLLDLWAAASAGSVTSVPSASLATSSVARAPRRSHRRSRRRLRHVFTLEQPVMRPLPQSHQHYRHGTRNQLAAPQTRSSGSAERRLAALRRLSRATGLGQSPSPSSTPAAAAASASTICAWYWGSVTSVTIAVCPANRRNLHSNGRTRHAVHPRQGSPCQRSRNRSGISTMLEGGIQRPSQLQAPLNVCRLRRLPRQEAPRLLRLLLTKQNRCTLQPRSPVRQCRAGRRASVIRNLRPRIAVQIHIAFARRHHGETPRCQQRAQPHAQLQRHRLLGHRRPNLSAAIVSAMSRVQHHYKLARRAHPLGSHGSWRRLRQNRRSGDQAGYCQTGHDQPSRNRPQIKLESQTQIVAATACKAEGSELR